jgi:hypothetical protein
MAANNLLKIQLHSIAKKELALLKQLSSRPFHYAEFFLRKLFEAEEIRTRAQEQNHDKPI